MLHNWAGNMSCPVSLWGSATADRSVLQPEDQLMHNLLASSSCEGSMCPAHGTFWFPAQEVLHDARTFSHPILFLASCRTASSMVTALLSLPLSPMARVSALDKTGHAMNGQAVLRLTQQCFKVVLS